MVAVVDIYAIGFSIITGKDVFVELHERARSEVIFRPTHVYLIGGIKDANRTSVSSIKLDDNEELCYPIPGTSIVAGFDPDSILDPKARERFDKGEQWQSKLNRQPFSDFPALILSTILEGSSVEVTTNGYGGYGLRAIIAGVTPKYLVRPKPDPTPWDAPGVYTIVK